jgi:protein TonB
MPDFPGGQAALMQYLAKNIKYPKEAIEANITGKVFVQFVIEKDGSITNAKIARSASTLLDAEALRIVNNMPQWIPGKQRGKAVRVAYTLPISFSLE